MYTDLNISYEGAGGAAFSIGHLQEKLITARQLGYNIVAVNYVTSCPLRPKDACKIPILDIPNPFSTPTVPSPNTNNTNIISSSSASLSSTSSSSSISYDSITLLKQAQKQQNIHGKQSLLPNRNHKRKRNDTFLYPPPSPYPSNSTSASASSSSSSAATSPFSSVWIQLNRLTLHIETLKDLNDLLASSSALSILSTYDILAFQPATIDILHAGLQTDLFHILDIDLYGGNRPLLSLTVNDIKKIQEYHTYIEIPYAPTLRDPHTNIKYLISNSQNILRLSRKKSILWTSNARSATDLRNPTEAYTVARNCLGLSIAQYHQAIQANSEIILAQAERVHSRLLRMIHGGSTTTTTSINNASSTNTKTNANSTASYPFLVVFPHPLTVSSTHNNNNNVNNSQQQQHQPLNQSLVQRTIQQNEVSLMVNHHHHNNSKSNNNHNNISIDTTNIHHPLVASLAGRGIKIINTSTTNNTKNSSKSSSSSSSSSSTGIHTTTTTLPSTVSTTNSHPQWSVQAVPPFIPNSDVPSLNSHKTTSVVTQSNSTNSSNKRSKV